ncbi:MAG TPA: EAL domain-containing protein [Telluria sp.]|nr:EAL domain-containing protein [Telluria sp.]
MKHRGDNAARLRRALAGARRALARERAAREQAQAGAQRATRLYHLLSQVNASIVRVHDKAELCQQVCEIAVREGGYLLASIALRDGPGGACGTLASCGRAGAGATAARIQFELRDGAGRSGVFILHADDPQAFAPEQLQLLEEVSADLSFALANLAHQQARRHGEARLRQLSRAVEQSANAVLITDRHGTIEYVNPWFTRITGYRPQDVLGRTPRILKSAHTHPEVHRRLWQTLLSGKKWHGELHNTKKNGDLYWCMETISPLKNDAGEVTHFVAITDDISDRKEAEQTIRHLAFHDALTGLPNRRLFRDRLAQALASARRNDGTVAVMLLDLDHFKKVNDTLGHGAGDELLVEVATRLRAAVRTNDTLARMGGDEFALIASDLTRPADAARLGAALVAALHAPALVQGHELQVGTSVGIALFPQDAADVDGMLKNADIALYRAKDHGRDNFQFFTAEMNAALRERVQLEHSLRGALDLGQLTIQYQPQMDLRDGRVGGVEALLRWRHPDLGLVEPGNFLPLAEATGLIGPIGDWVLRTVCTDARGWQDGGGPLRVAVNLSARQFRAPGLAARVQAILCECGLEPGLLELEVTEAALMEHPAHAAATLEALREIGVRIALDDFGTGYSSLARLQQLPVDVLKVDGSFVRDIACEDGARGVVGAVVALAHSLRLEVVAEGVETPQQLACLGELGCDAAQGYLFSGPVPAEALPALLGR